MNEEIKKYHDDIQQICVYLNTKLKTFATDGKNCIIKVQAQHLTTPEIRILHGASREEIEQSILKKVEATGYVTK